MTVWDSKTLKVRREVGSPWSEIVEWSPDGRWLAVRQPNGKVAILNAETLEVTKTLDTSIGLGIDALAWLPDSKRLVVNQEGAAAAIFDRENGKQVVLLESERSFAIATLDEGRQAVLEHKGRLRFYDTSTRFTMLRRANYDVRSKSLNRGSSLCLLRKRKTPRPIHSHSVPS